MTGNDGTDGRSPDPHLREQDRGILEAFARSEHTVLTNSEIADQVSLSSRQVRRRLDALEEDGVVGVRKSSGVRLAWLEADVREPITVQYPLLRYVFDRTGVQLFLVGVAGGIVAVLVLLAAAVAIGYGVTPPFVAPERLLIYGVFAAVLSATFVLVGVGTSVLEWGIRRYRESRDGRA